MKTYCLLMVAVVGLLITTGCPPAVCNGPDPYVDEIKYELVSASPAYQGGVVRIIAVVKNKGTAPFISGQGQQSIQIFETDNYISNLVHQQEFVNIELDGTIEAVYQTNWSRGDEFRPPFYKVMIAYDPDIFIDGNPQNDDCNLGNNQLIRDTSGLDTFF